MAASRSFPSGNNQVIRNYQGVMVRIRQNMPMCLPSRAPHYVPYRTATNFEVDKQEIWQVIKQYHGCRDVFDALGGYRKLGTEKDTILRELKTYFPTQYPTVRTNVSEIEEPDSIGDLIAQMPYLVVDKIKSHQRVNMTTDKKHINSEIRYLASKVTTTQQGILYPSFVRTITDKGYGRRKAKTDLNLKPTLRITLRNISNLTSYKRLNLY